MADTGVTLTPAQRALDASHAYRVHAQATVGRKVPDGLDPAGLRALAAALADGDRIAHERGLTTDAPFPGFGEPPVEMLPNVWKMVAITRLYADGAFVGSIVLNLITGRPVAVVLSDNGAIDPAWRPLAG